MLPLEVGPGVSAAAGALTPLEGPDAVERSAVAEPVDRRLVLCTEFTVADTETLLRCQAQHADLALVCVAVDVVGGLAGLRQRVHLRDRRVDRALRDEPDRLPRLAVVREVRADDPLERHPEVPVVVLVHVARGGRARGDDATTPCDVDAR